MDNTNKFSFLRRFLKGHTIILPVDLADKHLYLYYEQNPNVDVSRVDITYIDAVELKIDYYSEDAQLIKTFKETGAENVKEITETLSSLYESGLILFKEKLFVAFSHKLTQDQINDLKESLGIVDYILLRDYNPVLQDIFSNVDPELSAMDIRKEISEKIINAAEANGCTYLYVAGEPTVVLLTTVLAVNNTMRVIQSTTQRISKDIEMDDGTIKKVSEFKHVQWRDITNEILNAFE